MGRVLGVDLGSRRIGVALSDPSGVIAGPLVVLERRGDRALDHQAILHLAREHEADRIVVGMPTTLSGEQGPAATAALEEIEALQMLAGDGFKVEAFDERLTTAIAQRALLHGNVKRAQRKQMVDKVAAAVLLQSYLEQQRG